MRFIKSFAALAVASITLGVTSAVASASAPVGHYCGTHTRYVRELTCEQGDAVLDALGFQTGTGDQYITVSDVSYRCAWHPRVDGDGGEVTVCSAGPGKYVADLRF